MTYVSLFMPSGVVALALLTRQDGGPFVCEWSAPTPSERPRCAENAAHILWRHVREHAPNVYRKAHASGLVPCARCEGKGIVQVKGIAGDSWWTECICKPPPKRSTTNG